MILLLAFFLLFNAGCYDPSSSTRSGSRSSNSNSCQELAKSACLNEQQQCFWAQSACEDKVNASGCGDFGAHGEQCNASSLWCSFDVATKKCSSQLGYPAVTVAVATYDKRHAYHEHLYESFNKQDYPGVLELIVYDNGSKPSDFFSKLSDKRVKYIHTTKTPLELTLGAKRNFLVENSSGSFIAVWDDDDFYGANYISFMMQEIKTKQADFIKATKWLMAHFDKSGTTIAYHLIYPSLARSYGWGFAFVFNKKVYVDGGCRYLNENRLEEDAFAQCVHGAGYRFERIEFDTINKKPLMVKFESHAPAKYVGDWGEQYDRRYKLGTGTRNILASYSEDQVKNIDILQSTLLGKYIDMYFNSNK